MDDFLHDDSGQIVSVHIETDTLQETCTPFCVCSSYHDPNFIAKNELSLLVLDINLSTNPAVYNENHTTSYLQQLLRPPQG